MSIRTQECSSLQVVGYTDQSVYQIEGCPSSQCPDTVFLNVTPCKFQSQWHCVKNWPELLYWDLSAGDTKRVPWGSASYK